MANSLEGKAIAILATDGFEQSELLEPLEALRNEGADVEVIAPEGNEIQGFKHFTADRKVAVDRTLEDADAFRSSLEARASWSSLV